MDFTNTSCPLLASSFSFQILAAANLLTPLIVSNCHLVGSYPKDQSFPVFKNPYPEYDFIIVGAGSAGSTIANRLSEIPKYRVLLIEAGKDPPTNSDIPGLAPSLFESAQDWKYLTEPANDSCLGYINNQCAWPRGKVLGGSSTTNFMLAVRGNAKDYDKWESMGNPGWGYKDVLQYFIKSERVRTSRLGNNQSHGFDGNIYVEDFTNNTIYNNEIIQNYIVGYCKAAGYPIIEDILANHSTGVTISPGTIHDEVRWSTAKGYLQSARFRPNLIVMKGTRVTKILIDDKKRAYGVRVYKNGEYKDIFSKKEVIVSGGAINSPQLLMLSGIGPKDELSKFNIKVIQNASVGYNLQDHLISFGPFAKVDIMRYLFDSPVLTYLPLYLLNRTDSGFIPNTMLFFNTTGHEADWPNIQVYHTILPKINLPLFSIIPAATFKKEVINSLLVEAEQTPLLIMYPALLRPESRGSITLKSDNPFEKPKIVTGYLTHRKDVDALIEAFRTLEKISRTKTFLKHGIYGYVTLKSCIKHKPYSDDYLECLLRTLGSTIYHPVGTCKMGPASDPDAVVSPELKVKGIARLRVADASIMPTVVSGNTNLPTIMIAEKASDLIKADW